MRKLGKENRKLFVLLTLLVVVIIILFIYFIRFAITFDHNTYDIKAQTLFYDEEYRQVVPETKATLKKRLDGKYHLTVDNKEKSQYTIGRVALASLEDNYALHLYGTAYQISVNGEVKRLTKETKIAKAAPAKFYKLADRKYLFVDKKIYTAGKEINTKDYLLIELDKQGNATLANQEMNVKTINPIILKGSIFDFDVVHEKLIYEKNEIDLKNIIGSTNQYEDPKVEKEEEKKENEENKEPEQKKNLLNYYDQYFKNVVNSFNNLTNSVGSINDNSKNTIKKGEIYFDFSRWISLKKVTASVTSIELSYNVFDPNSEYQSVFALLKEENGERSEKIQLNKGDTSYIIRNLEPDSEYVISFGYRLVGEEEDVYEDTVKVKTRLPSYQLKITKVAKDKIYYQLKIDSNYAIESARVALYSDQTKITDEVVDVKKSAGYATTGSLPYTSLGYFIEVKLEDMVYNGNIITLDVSDKFINE